MAIVTLKLIILEVDSYIDGNTKVEEEYKRIQNTSQLAAKTGGVLNATNIETAFSMAAVFAEKPLDFL